MDAPVIIAGAGIAGLATAVALHRVRRDRLADGVRVCSSCIKQINM